VVPSERIPLQPPKYTRSYQWNGGLRACPMIEKRNSYITSRELISPRLDQEILEELGKQTEALQDIGLIVAGLRISERIFHLNEIRSLI